MIPKIIEIDPYLEPFCDDINLRISNYENKRKELVGNGKLSSFANGYKYFGIQKEADGYIYREWAPGADAMFFTGDFNGWDIYADEMSRLSDGVFEIKLGDRLCEGQNVQAIVIKNGQVLRRIPSYATRVVQDKTTYLWTAQVDTERKFPWTDGGFKTPKTPYIYECHIGMSGEKYDVSTYNDFTQNVLPRIKALGYNTIQIMAVMEHPYYGSFGYQVSNFFAPSSRFGTANELKNLINTAHSMGIAVLLDIVHSHSVKNVGDGLNEFDGTDYQYFHSGNKGNHPAWDTKLFDYGKTQVLHFLLSNIKYWLEVFHFDGFRFDGVTSMLYHDHGLGTAFCDYSGYFSMNTDTEAVTYLCLANALIKEVKPDAISIAEDMSGMPGMCLPIKWGGIGFDYRLSMGVPDLWIKYLKEMPDEYWNLGKLWWELTTRRPKEKVVGYCESHDQALVGDKTIMFRLCDSNMYTGMRKDSGDDRIYRGVALHKMIRLVTASLSGDGYLNFMGNEFGHPEWIDFPREGNGWSYHYCRRQWSLVDNKELQYEYLNNFDKEMLAFLKEENVLNEKPKFLYIHEDDKILAFAKKDKVFIFNFHPTKSFDGYFIPTGKGEFRPILSTDSAEFGGFSRIATDYVYKSGTQNKKAGIKIYLPSRTAVVLKKETK